MRPESQESVLRSRRKLKGEPISISDDLCVAMQNVLSRAKKDDRVEKYLSWRGKIFYQRKGSQEIKQLRFGEPISA